VDVRSESLDVSEGRGHRFPQTSSRSSRERGVAEHQDPSATIFDRRQAATDDFADVYEVDREIELLEWYKSVHISR
jgi:hypothetical protein